MATAAGRRTLLSLMRPRRLDDVRATRVKREAGVQEIVAIPRSPTWHGPAYFAESSSASRFWTRSRVSPVTFSAA